MLAEAASGHFATNAAEFRTLSGADYLEGCNFALTGVVTLVDPRRDLMVLQDDTGAVALNFPLRDTGLRVGQRVFVEGTNCFPYFAKFPIIRSVRPDANCATHSRRQPDLAPIT